MASSTHAAASASALSAQDASHSSLFRELHKSYPKQRLVPLPASTFHGRISIRPIVMSQGLNGSFRPASITASSVSEAVVDSSVNASPLPVSKLDIENAEDIPSEEKAEEETISAVMADVANLVKLVDSRDIVELELKHLDYELVIRKKEALAPPAPAPAPQVVAQAPYQIYGPPAAPPQLSQANPITNSAPAATAPAAATPPAAPAASPASKSDLPRILSPMAGTFYKCPAPGEPAFVKVGDRVQKGQVICIVEAMKLMNEIEADQNGTIVEIIAEDGKPVSVDTPLYAIKP